MTDPQVILNLGTGGSDLNGQNGSTSSADSNDARFLDWPGDNAGNYVYLPGVASNYLSVPDEAALDITGDIDIRARVALDDWTPATTSRLVNKWATTGQFSYALLVSSDGKVNLQWSTDGGTGAGLTTVPSTAATGLADGAVKWVRATLDVDNGAGGSDAKFYLSDDGVTWTQLGTTVTTAGTTSFYSSTSIVEIGNGSTGTNAPTAGYFYRAEVWDGIEGSGGTKVLDVDCSQIASGADTSFTALTGQTVSINRSTSGRKSVAVVSPVWLLGGDDFIEVADNALLKMSATQSFTLQVVVRQWTTPQSSGTYIAKHTSGGTNPGYYIRSNGTSIQGQAILDDGPNGAARTSATNSAGSLQVFSMVVDRSSQVMRLLDNTNQEQSDISISSVGSPDIVGPLRMGETSNGALNQDFEFLAAAVFRRALTSDEIETLSTYFQGRAY